MNEDRSNGFWIRFCIFAAILLVGLGVVEWLLGYETFFGAGNAKSEDWGNFGSLLQGTTASLWSLAGVFIILVAFLAQKQQLALQRKQFEQQSFENHFFQLLKFNRDIVDGLRISDGEEHIGIGSDVFRAFHRRMERFYEDRVEGPVENDTEALAVQCYEDAFEEKPELLGHYWRSLYHTIKFVNENGPVDKKQYTSIVRAQLSSYEHVLLHYNGLSRFGREKFMPLVQKYSLLENMGSGLLMNPQHPTAYSRAAFGDAADDFNYLAVNPPEQSPTLTSGSKSA